MQKLGDGKSQLDDWVGWTLIVWALTLVAFIYVRWDLIQYFALIDTDDNLRMVQVRDWLGGQGWYDLRQYRLAPPLGADIHWSRVVDLPLAAVILVLKPFFGQAAAETAAIALAPAFPLAFVFLALGKIARRTVAPLAWILAIALTLSASASIRMFMPTRIDHHGWQLAAVAVALMGLTDRRAVRGGMTIGLATAFSLAIGLESLPFLALMGGMTALRWVVDRGDATRLSAYAVSLGCGTALSFLLFASNSNWRMQCDALSPVWLVATSTAGLLLFGLSQIRVTHVGARLGLGVIAGGLLVGIMAYWFPQCLSRPEGLSEEAYKLWFQNIREVKPLYEQGFTAATNVIALPIMGLIGGLIRLKQDRTPLINSLWLPLTLLCAAALAMLFWQTRVGPVAQLLGIPGATALAWSVLLALRASRHVLIRTFGVILAFLTISGLITAVFPALFPSTKASPNQKLISNAFSQCTAASNLRTIGALPKAIIFTFVDLSPRLIAMTHHSAIAGPYHRNDDAIVDVHRAFSGTADEAHALIKRHKATLLLLCPNMAEATLNSARAPDGFYAQLKRGKIPAWLAPLPLPAKSPYLLWAVK
jgi:hypothetical protein